MPLDRLIKLLLVAFKEFDCIDAGWKFAFLIEKRATKVLV